MWLILSGSSSQIEIKHCSGFSMLDGSSVVELGDGQVYEGFGVVLYSIDGDVPMVINVESVEQAKVAYDRIADAVASGSEAVDLRDIR